MNEVLSQIREFFKTIHTGLFISCCCYAALLVALNYRFGIEPRIIGNIANRLHRFAGFYLVYLLAFGVPYLFVFLAKGKQIVEWKLMLLLIFIAPAIFALKVTFPGLGQFIQQLRPGAWGKFFSIVANLPSRLIIVLVPLLIIWKLGGYEMPFFGLTLKHFNWKPYALMLLLMMPLIAWASTQHDFLITYPKLKHIYFIHRYTSQPLLYNLLYEISYGIDFITIELFFRGFIVLAFVRFAGPDAILPMAVFYCSIHFGKPLAECISSFFGGLILGAVVYKTGSITGGLMVHLGIAWMMEAGGWLGCRVAACR